MGGEDWIGLTQQRLPQHSCRTQLSSTLLSSEHTLFSRSDLLHEYMRWADAHIWYENAAERINLEDLYFGMFRFLQLDANLLFLGLHQRSFQSSCIPNKTRQKCGDPTGIDSRILTIKTQITQNSQASLRRRFHFRGHWSKLGAIGAVLP